ncbi:unnamed protein product [Pleuronectes platessa]|uniref:Uncharacterized protein n=1 Tax=Pleuronectes platessa TaxID=8262 RepID=A0A9N7VB23_PLEPL|nr:unnamed protein product [Pleuronectes platessa]
MSGINLLASLERRGEEGRGGERRGEERRGEKGRGEDRRGREGRGGQRRGEEEEGARCVGPREDAVKWISRSCIQVASAQSLSLVLGSSPFERGSKKLWLFADENLTCLSTKTPVLSAFLVY